MKFIFLLFFVQRRVVGYVTWEKGGLSIDSPNTLIATSWCLLLEILDKFF